jgi:drug/metabolite transporter (DMT)-like permease
MGAEAWWLWFVLMHVVELVGDVALKRAGETTPLHAGWMVLGTVTYASTALGWLLLLRGKTLASFGVLSPVTSAVVCALYSVIILGERLSPREVTGVVLGLLVCVLLGGR